MLGKNCRFESKRMSISCTTLWETKKKTEKSVLEYVWTVRLSLDFGLISQCSNIAVMLIQAPMLIKPWPGDLLKGLSSLKGRLSSRDYIFIFPRGSAVSMSSAKSCRSMPVKLDCGLWISSRVFHFVDIRGCERQDDRRENLGFISPLPDSLPKTVTDLIYPWMTV